MLLVGVVGLQVPHLGGGVGEGAPAVVALVGFLAAVDQLVPFEVAGGGEELAAVVAAVLGLPRVPLLVEVQEADEAVALAALLAAVGLQGAAEETGPSRHGRRGEPACRALSAPTPAPPAGRTQLVPLDGGRKTTLLPEPPSTPMDSPRIPRSVAEAPCSRHCRRLSVWESPTPPAGCGRPLYRPLPPPLSPPQRCHQPSSPSLARWHRSGPGAAATCASSRGLCRRPGRRRLCCTPCRRRASRRCGSGCAA